MSIYEKPWQSIPSRLISHAIEHTKKNTDFDKIMAYLIIDVGVETIFKVFLEQDGFSEFKKANRNAQKDGRELSFHDITETIKLVASQRLQNVKIDESTYFHDKRNKLYHQGAGFSPMQEDLDGYLNLAKRLLQVLIGVDVDKPQEEELVQTNHSRFSLDGIQNNIISLQSNSSIMVEHLYPQIATRKIEAQLRYIRNDTGPDDESYPPSVRAELSQQRIDAVNKIIGREFIEDDYEFVEYIIDNPERLHVWLAFQEINKDSWSKDWGQYQSAVYFVEHKQVGDSKVDDKRYEEIYKWTHEKANIIYQWVNDHIPHVGLVGPDLYWSMLSDD